MQDLEQKWRYSLSVLGGFKASYPTSSQLVRGRSTKQEKQPKSMLTMGKLEA